MNPDTIILQTTTQPPTNNFSHQKCQSSERKRPSMTFLDLPWPSKTSNDLPRHSMTFHNLLWPSRIFCHLLKPLRPQWHSIFKCLMSKTWSNIRTYQIQSQINSHWIPRLDPIDSMSGPWWCWPGTGSRTAGRRCIFLSPTPTTIATRLLINRNNYLHVFFTISLILDLELIFVDTFKCERIILGLFCVQGQVMLAIC